MGQNERKNKVNYLFKLIYPVSYIKALHSGKENFKEISLTQTEHIEHNTHYICKNKTYHGVVVLKAAVSEDMMCGSEQVQPPSVHWKQ